jgi:excisionase family DNA binding protein
MYRSELLRLGEVAKMLGVNRATIGRRIAAGELPAFRSAIDRRSVFVPRRDVEMLQAREFEPVSRKTAASAA